MMVRPDGFTGAVMAIEGIEDAHVLLHGPDGCRKNLAVLSSHCRRAVEARPAMSEPFFKGLPRVPCTGVVSSDYIFGACGRVADALEALKRRDPGLVAVVPTPGASLIGDDIAGAIEESGMGDRAFVLDVAPEHLTLARGFDRAICEAVRRLGSRSGCRRGTAVLLGLSVLAKDWTTVAEEFSGLLALMGLEVICIPGAVGDADAIRASADAEIAVVLCPEYAEETSRLYRDAWGIPVVSPGFSPVGFEATLLWLDAVAEAAGRDASAAREQVRRSMRRAHRCMEASGSRVMGSTFRVDADASVAYPLVRWLMESFSMVPSSVDMPPGGSPESIESLSAYLGAIGLEEIIGGGDGGFADVVLCDGNTARLLQAAKRCRKGIDISFPSISDVDFRPSPIFGASGALYLMDRLMNTM